MNMNKHDIIEPITPDEAKKRKEENWKQNLPAPVLEAINDCIVKNMEPHSFVIDQNEMMKAILDRLAEGRKEYAGDESNMPWYYAATRQQVYDNKWLDFEPLYRKVGWKVEYYKPDFNEAGPAFWRFFSNV